MKFWLDCEFDENGKTIDLISIGLVAEDGRTYYAESIEYDRSAAHDWLRANVLPKLEGPVKTTKAIAADLVAFCGENPEIWGWYGSYDWVALCQLFGTMMQLPKGWPMFIREAKQLDYGQAKRIPRDPLDEHHALHDAEWQRDVYWSLVSSTKRVLIR